MSAEGLDAAISIRTPSGVVSCKPGDIICKRLGLDYQLNSILLEYEVPSQKLLAHHAITVDLWELHDLDGHGQGGAKGSQADASLAERLRASVHRPWLVGVSRKQLIKLVGRLRAQADRARRKRVVGLPTVARARRTSKDPEIEKVFKEVDTRGDGVLSRGDLHGYLCDYLGFGRAEADSIFRSCCADVAKGMSFDDFKKGYGRLNPFMLASVSGEVLVRKPGSLNGQQVNLDKVEDSEVYVCDPTAQIFVDFCKGSLIMLGPCESSVFVRDCEDCVFWLACGQLRTNNCKRCTFHLYSKTEPVIETSEDLAFAPWTVRYPRCSEHFARWNFDPQRNLWNGIFDFTGSLTKANWRILPLEEVVELCIGLDEPPEALAPPENPCPSVTHEVLCADPATNGDCGQGVANIPQTRPALPPEPAAGAQAACWVMDDRRCAGRPIGLRHLEERLRLCREGA